MIANMRIMYPCCFFVFRIMNNYRYFTYIHYIKKERFDSLFFVYNLQVDYRSTEMVSSISARGAATVTRFPVPNWIVKSEHPAFVACGSRGIPER